MNESGQARVRRALGILTHARPGSGTYANAAIGPYHRPSEVKLAKDSAGQIRLLIELDAGTERFAVPLGTVMPVQWIEGDGHRPDILDILCTESKLVDTFTSMIGEMLDRQDSSGRAAIDELREVLDAWRFILAQQNRVASRSHIIGLFGELTMLVRLARENPRLALESWRGTEGYRHDFYKRNAVEIKTYTTLDSPRVNIHGAFQLDPPTTGHLHLVTVRLEEAPEGDTISDLINDAVNAGIPRTELLGRSNEECPIIVDGSLRFAIAETRIYEVLDDFPGIRASRLSEDDLKGVERLHYSLMLDACPNRRDESLLDGVLGSL